MPLLASISKDNKSEEVYPIDKDTISAGRLPSNDIVLLDSSVSRNHFVIKKEKDGYYIADNGSSNGTLVNDKKVTGKTRLKNHDSIRAGKVVLVYKDDEFITVKEVSPSELGTIASSTSVPNNVYLNIIFSVAREGIYTHDQKQFYAHTIKLICNALKADYGAILVIDEATGMLSTMAESSVRESGTASISSSILDKSIKNRAGILVKNAGIDYRFTGDRTIQSMAINSAMCAPAWEKDHTYGALYVDRTIGKQQFTEENLNFITIIANLLALTMAHEKLVQRIADEKNLTDQIKRFVPIEAVSGFLDMIKNNPSSLWNVQEVSRSTILFADIVGFTSLTERSRPREIARMLRIFFEKATDIILTNGGSVNKFLGDGLMAVFGTPISHDDDPDRAISSAMALIKWVKSNGDGIDISLRIGIDTGPVLGIMVGSSQRLEYTVIGDSVNVASRLQAIADVNHIAISRETNSYIKTPVSTKLIGEITVKGKENPVTVYQVSC
ncbi:MAG: FHA domain-containing protein [Deltaproteobacteria bacterium]|nr:FHA domain-containing protein [Deltaproteobacteria bacterium]MCL5276861.1 FHA domain-containing protein [Deltaproteobacteria bacterium]